ncbi:hypothetical protein C2G38_878852 [Gigaspora rosea]|uniref:Uncharacterized protein n=1 Tax=Gigaspora rosea TaxID=44941 RepID=A0A397W8G6_9GLOM|nr:hypothetical protein C2G38_878852 [Gigaspora rosea]
MSSLFLVLCCFYFAKRCSVITTTASTKLFNFSTNSNLINSLRGLIYNHIQNN